MRFVRENGLSLFFGVLFLAALGGQSVAGHAAYNQHQLEHGDAAVSYGRYVSSSDFGRAMLENWQSEYLQFALFILATIWLVQRGSNESKPLENAGRESEQQQRLGPYSGPKSPRWSRFHGGVRRAVYSNSLILLMLAIFVLSWFGQSVTGWTTYNDEQRQHDEPTVSWSGYVVSPDFWEDTLENWQSEFLAVGTMAVFTIYLRQRGSPESKPVGAAHDETGASG
jgi:Arc/MetJ-type ribon-helix-helix transcriptional regulator